MRRPSTGLPEYAKANFFAAGKHGFTGGTPGVEAATILRAEQMNSITGELSSVVETYGGASLDSARYDQVLDALQSREELRALCNGSYMAMSANDHWCDFASDGAGTIVAVGGNSGAARIWYSTNGGTTWTQATTGGGFNYEFMCVIYGGGQFVACSASGTGTIQTSPDGITWTQRSTEDVAQVAYGGGTYVGILWGGGGTVTSTDGVTWTTHVVAQALSNHALAYGAGLFVAPRKADTHHTEIYTSADGVTWTQRSWGSGASIKGLRLYRNDTHFVAHGNDSSGTARELQISTDGITWTRARAGGGAAGALVVTPRCAYSLSAGSGLDWALVGGISPAGLDFKKPTNYVHDADSYMHARTVQLGRSKIMFIGNVSATNSTGPFRSAVFF